MLEVRLGMGIRIGSAGVNCADIEIMTEFWCCCPEWVPLVCGYGH